MDLGIVLLLIGAVLIGVFAQRGRGRTGVLWAMLALGVGAGIWWFLYTTMYDYSPERFASESMWRAVSVMAFFGQGIIMGLVVATLPRRASATGTAPRDARETDTRPCPHCAEPIKAAAKICRFCGRDVEPTVTVEERKRRCLDCMSMVPISSRQCPQCGAGLP